MNDSSLPPDSNGHDANGYHADGAAPFVPQIRAPEGVRAARGELDAISLEKTAAPGKVEMAEMAEMEDFTAMEEVEAPFGVEIEETEVAPEIQAPIASPGDPGEGRDREMGLMEHLTELRTRLIYSFIAVGLATVLTWNQAKTIIEWFAKPILAVLKIKQVPGIPNGSPGVINELISTDPTAFFSIYFQVSLIAALLLTMPFLLFQVWRFIEPAMTKNERKFTIVLVPFSSTLFFMGAGLGYLVSPLFFQFFLAFQPEGVAAKWDYGQSIVLMAKMLLVFGVAFQVPVVTIFLNKAGLVSRNFLIEYWRHAVILIFVVVAVITPTWDPITLTVCAAPPCLLYILSIWLVKWL